MTVLARFGVRLACLLLFVLTLTLVGRDANAGTFIDSEILGLDLIVHPLGYDGTGGQLAITVCIDPTSTNSALMFLPTEHAIDVWNDLVSTISNVEFTIPADTIDFESVLLHELGHAVFALGHPNLGTDTGVSDSSDPITNFTKSTKGADGSFDLDDGVDDVSGSSDDLRDDDENLHWFEKNVNNPFTIPATVDSVTYSRDVTDLPLSDSFPANGDFDVSSLFGVPSSEAVMQQGSFLEEAQRTLVADDVATLRLGMSGIDEVQGTADDYMVALSFAGLTTSCDIVLDFDNTTTSFASTIIVHSTISGAPADHRAVTGAEVFFNTGPFPQSPDPDAIWFFTANTPPDQPHSPAPTDSAIDVPVATDLSWIGGDPDTVDDVLYDVLLEKDNPNPTTIACNDIDMTTCSPAAPLDMSSSYYWQVIATDNHGASTTGPVWSFTTVNQPPLEPANPSPTDGSTEVPVTTDLSWIAGDPDAGNTVLYDVLLDKGNPTPTTAACDDIIGTTCSPAVPLDSFSTYYWQVVATDNHGATTVGPVWSFTTPCPTGQDLVLIGMHIGTASIFAATSTITAAPDFVVEAPGGDVTFVAGESIILRDGFSVESGARFAAELSPGCAAFGNAPPNLPASPSPPNGATEVSDTTDLAWTGGDPDAGDTVLHDVLLEKGNPTPTTGACDDIIGTTCSPAVPLDSFSTYYWQVVATDNHGATTVGPVWSFTTPCPTDQDLVLINMQIGMQRIFGAISSISAGPDFVVEAPGGDVTFHVGSSVILNDGFAVENGARFSVEISLDCVP